MRRLAVALVHHPVLDREGEVVTTAITNLDLHDISRTAVTFGVSDFFVVHPVAAQRELAERVRAHWTSGAGARRIPDRRRALEGLRITSTLEEVLETLDPEVWTTSARPSAGSLTHDQARVRLGGEGPAVLLVLGTGWGLAPGVLERADAHLAPVQGTEDYNHLSVRAAAAILLDRLVGDR